VAAQIANCVSAPPATSHGNTTIPHSKHFHHAYARSRKGVIDVISQGSGGAFVVTLDEDSGEHLARIKVQ